MKKKKVITNSAPDAPSILSQAIISNRFIFVSGQIHTKPNNEMLEGSVSDKLNQIMSNISKILEAANSRLDDIVKVTIYVTDMSQMLELNKSYADYFTQPYPAREAVCVKELPLGATIEISVVAAI